MNNERALRPDVLARIKIVDLSNPPPFIRVLRDVEDLRELPEDRSAEFWAYTPEWDEHASLFNRGQTGMMNDLPTIGRGGQFTLHSDYGDYIIEDGDEYDGACKYFGGDQAGSFIDRLMGLGSLFQENLTGCKRHDLHMRFGTGYERDSIHIDRGVPVRGLLATEFSNTILFESRQIDAAREEVQIQGVEHALNLGIDAYALPLGTFGFHRGHYALGTGSMIMDERVAGYHAAAVMPHPITHLRPLAAYDFS